MEKLVNEFTVQHPIDETWAILLDVERIAPCMPGAQLEEIEGDTYRGVVKVKLGAISTAFKGQANFVERDDAKHRAVLHGAGRDTTGKGNADAMITAQLESIGPDSTKCVVSTDLHITGKVAQFGRGIMGDVSKKLMDQFASNLNRMLDEQGPTPADSEPATAAAEASPAVDTASAPAGGNGASTAASEPRPTVRKINGPAAEPVDLAGVAGPAVIKRVLPIVLALLVVVLLLRRRK